MSMTCFPYGFPTGYALSPRGSSRIWPRCTNAEPGSYGQECGEPAGFIGSRADGGQSCSVPPARRKGLRHGGIPIGRHCRRWGRGIAQPRQLLCAPSS